MQFLSLQHFLKSYPWLSWLTRRLFFNNSENDVDCIGTLQYWRERILSSILLFGIIFALIPYIQGMILAFQENAIGIAIIDTLVYGIAIGLFLSRKIKFEMRVALTIGILYTVGLAVLIYRGPVTSGLIYLFSFSFFGGILLGLKAAILTLAINALTLLGIGWFLSTGQAGWGAGMVLSPGRWLVTSLNFLFLAGAAAISTAVMVKGLQTSLLREKSTSEELAMEVAERKRAEELLNAHCVLLRIAEKTAKFGGWIVDIAENKIKWSDEVAAICEMPVEYSPSVDEGINFYAPEWRDKMTIILKDCVEKGISYDEEMEIITASGKRIWVRMIGQPVRDESGNIIKIQGTLQNINDRKRSERDREKLQAQLNQSQKLESVGRLAGGVAHDFNNMLGVIMGYAEMAMLKISPNDPLHADIEEILKAAKRSADIAHQLLAYARKQPIKPRALDLNKTVKNLHRMLQRSIGENIDLAWVPTPKLWPVEMDPAQVNQLLVNLCVNARDAIEGIGKISIEMENITFTKDYCADHAGFFPGEFVLLSFSDNGCGMDKETLDKIFEPFFTTKDFGKSSGLGMATVYGIVKQNNGFINVYSEPGKGTTFKIYLPRHTSETRETKVESVEKIPRSHGETVLLVEDEPAILKMSKMMLENLGYRVLAAGTPGEAMRLAEEHTGKIHVLVTDVIMPEMNGRDLADQLQRFCPDMKVLFMSGYTADVIAHHGVLDEGVHFIRKPFLKMDIALKIRKALEQS